MSIVIINKIQGSSKRSNPVKSFGQLLDISLKKIIFIKTSGSQFLYIKLLFTNQNSKPIEMKDKINITLVINQSIS